MIPNRKFIYGRIGRWQGNFFVWLATFKFLFLIILDDFNDVDLFLHNVCGINGSVPMNNAFFSIQMKAYPSDVFNMQIGSCDSSV